MIPSSITDDIEDEGAGGFSVSHCYDHRRDRRVCYTLPIDGAPKLFLKSAPEIILCTCLPFISFRFNFLGREFEQFQAYRTVLSLVVEFLYRQRMDDVADLDDFKICNKYDIDNTGLVC